MEPGVIYLALSLSLCLSCYAMDEREPAPSEKHITKQREKKQSEGMPLPLLPLTVGLLSPYSSVTDLRPVAPVMSVRVDKYRNQYSIIPI